MALFIDIHRHVSFYNYCLLINNYFYIKLIFVKVVIKIFFHLKTKTFHVNISKK